MNEKVDLSFDITPEVRDKIDRIISERGISIEEFLIELMDTYSPRLKRGIRPAAVPSVTDNGDDGDIHAKLDTSLALFRGIIQDIVLDATSQIQDIVLDTTGQIQTAANEAETRIFQARIDAANAETARLEAENRALRDQLKRLTPQPD